MVGFEPGTLEFLLAYLPTTLSTTSIRQSFYFAYIWWIESNLFTDIIFIPVLLTRYEFDNKLNKLKIIFKNYN